MFKNSYKLRFLLSLFVILSYQYTAYASDYTGGESNPKRLKTVDTNKSDDSEGSYDPLDLDFLNQHDYTDYINSINIYPILDGTPQEDTADKDNKAIAHTMPLFHNNNRDVKCMIVGFIPPKDLISFSLVCKEALELVQIRGRVKFLPKINILDGWTDLKLLNGVKVLNLSECKLGSEGAKILAQKLGDLPLLKELILEKSELFKGPNRKSIDGFKALIIRMAGLNNLTHLNLGINLGGSRLTLGLLAAVSISIGNLTRLEKLRLPYSDCSLQLDTLGFLEESEHAKKLLIKWPGKLKALVNLKELDMTNFPFSELRGEALQEVFANLTKLETLSLSNSNLDHKDMIGITKSLAKLSGLRKLDLSYIGLSTDHKEFEDICSNLGNMTSLKNLNLSYTLFEGKGMNELCKALIKLDNISELHLESILTNCILSLDATDINRIKDAADLLSSTLIRLTRLTVLDLSNNKIEQLYGREKFEADIRYKLTGLRSLKLEDGYDDNHPDFDSDEDDFYETSDEI